MRLIIVFVFLVLLGFPGAYTQAAPIPADVLKPYQAYNKAYREQDFKAALKHAKSAWEKAEQHIGEGKTTADLAYNYGSLASKLGKTKPAIAALERSIELTDFDTSAGVLVRLEREVLLTTILLGDDAGRARKRVNRALKFAQKNNGEDNIFYGELQLYKALAISRSANRAATASTRISRSGAQDTVKQAANIQENSADYARKALVLFEKTPELAQPILTALAHKLVGFSQERDKEWLDATLSYQKAMLIQKEFMGLNDPGYATILGRWLNARNYVTRKIRASEMPTHEAQQLMDAGICRCWPFDSTEPEVERVAKIVTREAPRMPPRATTSGYAIVQFDLNDGGDTTNIRVVHAWPEKIFTKSSARSVKQWKYSPRVSGETDAQRKGFIVPMHYFLTDLDGSPI